MHFSGKGANFALYWQQVEYFLYILTRGMAIGTLISAPMGPIGMLIIQRTLSKGRWPAFFTGIGAALSDLLYCLLAGFGLSFITDIIERHQFALQIFGSIVLAAFGLFLFRKNPTRSLKTAEIDSRSYWSDFISGFFLTFSNPLILFFIIGLFARFNFILPEYILFHYVWAYITIFGGAIIWWYVVTFLVSKLRSRFNVRSLWLVNRIVGTILITMAVIGVIIAINEHLSI